MKKREINKKIVKVREKYFATANKINEDHEKLVHASNMFRMKCVERVFKLMHKDKELKKLNKMWAEL